MAKTEPYEACAVCECGHTVNTSFGDVWFADNDYPFCPECGRYKPWKLASRRWVWDGWFRGHYEVRRLHDAHP